jgi:hypothetical protein
MEEMEARMTLALKPPPITIATEIPPLVDAIFRETTSVEPSSVAPLSADGLTILPTDATSESSLYHELSAAEIVIMLQDFHQCYGKIFPYLITHDAFTSFSLTIASNHEHGRANLPEEDCMLYIMLATIYQLRSQDPNNEDAKYYADLAFRRVSVILLKPTIIGVQCLLYMVSYLLHTPRTAETILASAIRHTQHLRLDRSMVLDHGTKQHIERHRIFWTAFIFDKTLSLRLGHSPMLSSSDVSIELPLDGPDHDVGVVSTLDGKHHFNHFLQYAHLACLQDRVYHEATGTESSGNATLHVISILEDLGAWCEAARLEFRPAAALTTLNKFDRQLMLELHLHYFHTLSVAHGLWTQNATWLQQVAELPRQGPKFENFQSKHGCCVTWGSLMAKLIGEMSVETVMDRWYKTIPDIFIRLC